MVTDKFFFMTTAVLELIPAFSGALSALSIRGLSLLANATKALSTLSFSRSRYLSLVLLQFGSFLLDENSLPTIKTLHVAPVRVVSFFCSWLYSVERLSPCLDSSYTSVLLFASMRTLSIHEKYSAAT